MSKISAHLPSSITPFSFISQIARQIRIVSLLILLGCTVPAWFLTEAIAPQLVRAYTARVDLAIDRLPQENYETVLRRAEAAVKAAAQMSFERDIFVTDVSIIVSVQNQGEIAPVIALDVSRPQWRSCPDVQNWATYFKMARSLLLFENSSNPVPAASSMPAKK